MTASPRAPVAALALVLAVALIGCGDDGDPTIEAPATTSQTTLAAGARSSGVGAEPEGNTFNFTVRGGSVEGPSRVRVNANQAVVLRVTSDTEDEVHVHGYDKTAEVGPGKAAEVALVANIPGTFEVELEKAHRRITTLEVQP